MVSNDFCHHCRCLLHLDADQTRTGHSVSILLSPCGDSAAKAPQGVLYKGALEEDVFFGGRPCMEYGRFVYLLRPFKPWSRQPRMRARTSATNWQRPQEARHPKPGPRAAKRCEKETAEGRSTRTAWRQRGAPGSMSLGKARTLQILLRSGRQQFNCTDTRTPPQLK